MEASEAGEVPEVVVKYTCWVVTGIMANFTIALPLSVYWKGGLLPAAGLISAYAAGALVSLTFWSSYDRRAIRAPYLTHACLMVVGNVLFMATFMVESEVYAWAARFVLGLEGGAMYNANLALISLSTPATRVKYLSYYQGFVGFGLVLGPTIASTATAIALAGGFAFHFRVVFSAGFMVAWGACLLCALTLFMPDDATTRQAVKSRTSSTGSAALNGEPSSPSSGPLFKDMEREQWWVLSLACLGNFMRIFQRLAWEVGAVVLFAEYFHWGATAAGFALSAYGAIQAAAQYYYAGSRMQRSVKQSVVDLGIFESLEIIAVCGMFSKTDATKDWRVFFNITFVVASVVFYVASCLTSAPLNDLILLRAQKVNLQAAGSSGSASALLAIQYGIFAAFFCAPVASRTVFLAGGLDTPSVAGLLAVGWAVQTLANACTVGRIDSARPIAVGICLALVLTWISFDKAVGGCGLRNVFSWHPVAMGWAFFAAMTPGHYAYRADAGFLVKAVLGQHADAGGDSRDAPHRQTHLRLMVGAVCLAVVGYCCILAAHVQSGESQIGVGETSSRAAHVALGYTALLWLAVQAAAGGLKHRALVTTGQKTLQWHAHSGKALLLLIYATATLGFWLRMNYTNQGPWHFGTKLALTAGTAFLFGSRLFPASFFPPNGIDDHRDIDRPSHDQGLGGDTSTQLA